MPYGEVIRAGYRYLDAYGGALRSMSRRKWAIWGIRQRLLHGTIPALPKERGNARLPDDGKE